MSQPGPTGQSEAQTLEEAKARDPEVPAPLEQRLQAMEAARPSDALTPRELAGEAGQGEAGEGGALSHTQRTDAIEAAQLAAFEAGEGAWWLARPESLAGHLGGEGEEAVDHRDRQDADHEPPAHRFAAAEEQSHHQRDRSKGEHAGGKD